MREPNPRQAAQQSKALPLRRPYRQILNNICIAAIIHCPWQQFLHKTYGGNKTVNVAVNYEKTYDENGAPHNLIRLHESQL